MGLSAAHYSVLTLAFVAILSLFVLPLRCNGRKSTTPFDGCRKEVHGILGRCTYHGRCAERRVMALMGGRRILDRRVCSACGSPRIFIRLSGDGAPALGCSSFPRCKNPRVLKNYGL